jgi:hypothetical protein
MMETATKRTGGRRRKLAPSVMALILAAAIGAAWTAPVRAENDGDQGRGHKEQRFANGHDNRREDRRDDRDGYEGRYYQRPAYVYAPPPVYYAPPPVYYAPPPVVDLVFPLRFN